MSIEGGRARKPPEPSRDDGVVDAWLRELVPRLQPVVAALDQTIRGVLPDLQHAVKYERAFYGSPELGWIIELAPYDVSVNVVFLGGAELEPPPPLGTAGRSRYVKVTNLDDAARPDLREWIGQAGRTPGWR